VKNNFIARILKAVGKSSSKKDIRDGSTKGARDPMEGIQPKSNWSNEVGCKSGRYWRDPARIGKPGFRGNGGGFPRKE
jgi:hypothetical protein